MELGLVVAVAAAKVITVTVGLPGAALPARLNPTTKTNCPNWPARLNWLDHFHLRPLSVGDASSLYVCRGCSPKLTLN